MIRLWHSYAQERYDCRAPSPHHRDIQAGSREGLRIDVKTAGSKEGTLNVGRGSVEWWPEYKSVNAHRATWRKFIEILERMPKRRSRRRIAKTSG
jgi:hypothetical protein